jgi:two-component system LytT family response regulator
MKVLIVDDEALARRSVARHLRSELPDASPREAEDGVAALEIARTWSPDLMFLDVEMPELSGIDVLRLLPTPRPKVIFVTAHAQFAVDAFAHNACDYLVKPFTADRFRAALTRALGELENDARLLALERSLGDRLERLALRYRDRVDVVPISTVGCFVSRGHYTYVYAGEREYLTELTLVHLEERLDPERFARSHRSVILRLDQVVEVSDKEVTLRGGMRVPLARRCRTPLLKLLGR